MEFFAARPADRAGGVATDAIQKTVNRQIKNAGAKGDRQSFHSLCHNFRDALREADVSRDAILGLGGWAAGGTEELYGGLRPSSLAREIAKVQYPGPNLSQLYAPSLQSLAGRLTIWPAALRGGVLKLPARRSLESTMPSEDEKSKIEIMTFRAFANCHGLPIDLNSVEKRDPPEPDILCKSLDESFIAFELAEICNNDLAEELNQPTGQAFWTSSKLQDILKKKISKVYDTIHPVDLLLYVDGREITPDDVIIPEIEYQVSSIRRSKIRLKRIWFLGRKQSYLVCDFT